MFDPEITAAVKRCIDLNIPFALYSLPNESDFDFFATLPDSESPDNLADLDPDSDWEGMAVGFFLGEGPVVGIKRSLSAADILALPDSTPAFDGPDLTPTSESTQYMEYVAQAHQLISRLKKRGGKTVLSRLIAVNTSNTVTDVAERYFSRLPDTFRFIYFTPETGLWMGATPELLLDYDYTNRHVITMSLAGTRESDPDNPDREWDEKNREEHDYVTTFILNCLEKSGLHPEVTHRYNRPFGHLEHLCDIIESEGPVDVERLMMHLSPTPAVCGMPQKEALSAIFYFESHERHCYGGWVGVKRRDGFRAYVNLRSAFLDSTGRYNIYAGGGLTAKSCIEEEWQEAASKAAPLYNAVVTGSSLQAPTPESLRETITP